MSDLAQLLVAIGGMVAAILGGVAGLVTAIRTSGKERPRAAAKGATRFAEQLAAAAEDGVLTPEEIEQAVRDLQQDGEGES
ncbi:hypothetical protein ACIBCH_20540 [Amycolatopsis thailandensis]|uniref:hypothetical protein n=1 Tax=Amycolatopsis thailandensis TaxID=589330 RepID=UPI0037A01A3A